MSEEITEGQDPTAAPATAAPAVAAPAPAEAAPAEAGVTTVSDELVEKIAAAAARAVPGVADLGGDVVRFVDQLLDKVGLDEVGDATRGVAAKVVGTDVSVTVVLVIAAGQTVPEVTAAVRRAVTDALVQYGLNVTGVNVKVDDVATA